MMADGVETGAGARKRRARDPAATRAAILEAASAILAQDGPEGLSLSEVAARAGVNRGTAYQHFAGREALVAETVAWVSGRLYSAVFGEPVDPGVRAVERVDMVDLTDRLAAFAMANPALCRVWLLQVLASPDPASDPFWREYEGSIARFAGTGLAEPGIDPEALSVIMLAGAFLWPVWAQAHGKGAGPARLRERFVDECLRLSLFGTLRTGHHPDIASRLARPRPD